MGNKQSYDVQHSDVVVTKGEIRKVSDTVPRDTSSENTENVHVRAKELDESVSEVPVDVEVHEKRQSINRSDSEEDDGHYAVPSEPVTHSAQTVFIAEKAIVLETNKEIIEDNMESSALKVHPLHRTIPPLEMPLDKEPTQSSY